MEDKIWDVISKNTNDHDGNKTLIFVDDPSENSLELFLNSSKYVVLDASLLAKKKSIQKKTVSYILEEARFSLIYAIRHGKVLVVRMSDSKTDFVNTFCDECCEFVSESTSSKRNNQCLPRSFLLQSGYHLVQKPFIHSFLRRGDQIDCSDEACMRIVQQFKVVITTTIPTSKIEQQLLNGSIGLPGTVDNFNIVDLKYLT